MGLFWKLKYAVFLSTVSGFWFFWTASEPLSWSGSYGWCSKFLVKTHRAPGQRLAILFESNTRGAVMKCIVGSDSADASSVGVRLLSHVWLSASLWTVAYQAPLSVKLSRQECWSGLPFLTPGDLPNPGIEPKSLASPAFSVEFFTRATREVPFNAVAIGMC